MLAREILCNDESLMCVLFHWPVHCTFCSMYRFRNSTWNEYAAVFLWGSYWRQSNQGHVPSHTWRKFGCQCACMICWWQLSAVSALTFSFLDLMAGHFIKAKVKALVAIHSMLTRLDCTLFALATKCPELLRRPSNLKLALQNQTWILEPILS
jgi:hypothetical protein